MVERSLSMREVLGSMPNFSTLFFPFNFYRVLQNMLLLVFYLMTLFSIRFLNRCIITEWNFEREKWIHFTIHVAIINFSYIIMIESIRQLEDAASREYISEKKINANILFRKKCFFSLHHVRRLFYLQR